MLAYIRDELCIPRNLPFLTAIVVQKATGLPGSGWLPNDEAYRLSPAEYELKWGAYRDRVFRCDRWDALLEELGLSPVQKTAPDLDEEGRAYAEYLARSGEAEETDSHRALKEHVADHPIVIGLSALVTPSVEYLFPSGDRCDIVFELPEGGHAVVEIKDGERGELVKGIYQAVKYRALLEAEQGHGDPYPVRAYLVAYDQIPEDIQDLARKLAIDCRTIPRWHVAPQPVVREERGGPHVEFDGVMLTRERILAVLRDFREAYPDTNQYDRWLDKGNYKYALEYGDSLYPPKHILSEATGISTALFSGGEQTNRVFRELGFRIAAK